jgi:hypothetical protein
MTDMNGSYVEFLEAVVPDVNKEIDRICMAVLDIDLQDFAQNRKTYKENAAKLRAALYQPSSSEAHGDSGWLYPGQHLCYWFDFCFDRWSQVKPPASIDANVDALEELLEAARRIQRLIDHEQAELETAQSGRGHDPISVAMRAAQKQTIDSVLAWHDPSRKSRGRKPTTAVVTAATAKRAATRKAAKPSKRAKGARKASGAKAASAAAAGTS